MFRGNPAHSGVYEGGGVARFIGLQWKFHTGGMVVGSPAVAEGKFILAARMEIYMR